MTLYLTRHIPNQLFNGQITDLADATTNLGRLIAQRKPALRLASGDYKYGSFFIPAGYKDYPLQLPENYSSSDNLGVIIRSNGDLALKGDSPSLGSGQTWVINRNQGNDQGRAPGISFDAGGFLLTRIAGWE